MGPLRRQNVLTLDDVTAKAQNGPLIAKLAGVVTSRQERKSAKGNRFAFVGMSDPTGNYEVTLFSDTLEASREHLDAGSNVVMTVEATLESDQLKLLGRSVAPIDSAVAAAGSSGLRIFIEDAAAVAVVAGVLDQARKAAKQAARGPVQLCLQHPSLPGEVEMDLGTDFAVNPQVKGALKSLDGVVTVEDL